MPCIFTSIFRWILAAVVLWVVSPDAIAGPPETADPTSFSNQLWANRDRLIDQIPKGAAIEHGDASIKGYLAAHPAAFADPSLWGTSEVADQLHDDAVIYELNKLKDDPKAREHFMQDYQRAHSYYIPLDSDGTPNNSLFDMIHNQTRQNHYIQSPGSDTSRPFPIEGIQGNSSPDRSTITGGTGSSTPVSPLNPGSVHNNAPTFGMPSIPQGTSSPDHSTITGSGASRPLPNAVGGGGTSSPHVLTAPTPAVPANTPTVRTPTAPQITTRMAGPTTMRMPSVRLRTR